MTNRTGDRPRLSVVMIARDEADRIGDALQSVQFADELIVADTESRDNTVEIARSLGAKVYAVAFNGFGATKQRALDYASGRWVLVLDADERVTPALREEIERVVAGEAKALGYYIPRQAWFLGREMKHGGWARDRVLRLFMRDRGRFSTDAVHERVLVDGPVDSLNGYLEHHTDPNITHYLLKIDRYSTLGAEKIAKNPRKRTGMSITMLHSLGTLVRMLKRGMWRDGPEGVFLTVSSVYSTFLRYWKADRLRRMQG
ncbi:glycosyltransferase [bacterium]|nr:glycosyltransferase [bacterium]